MNYQSPFTLWFDANITQMAVSPEILKLLAMAFEGGQISERAKTLTNEEIDSVSNLLKITYSPLSNEVTLKGVREFARAILRKAQEQ